MRDYIATPELRLGLSIVKLPVLGMLAMLFGVGSAFAGTLDGKVLRQTGSGLVLEAADVTVFDEYGDVFAELTTQTGRFVITVPAGEYTIEAEAISDGIAGTIDIPIEIAMPTTVAHPEVLLGP